MINQYLKGVLTPMSFTILNDLVKGSKSSIQLRDNLLNKGFEQRTVAFYSFIKRLSNKNYLTIEERHNNNLYHITDEGRNIVKSTKEFFK